MKIISQYRYVELKQLAEKAERLEERVNKNAILHEKAITRLQDTHEAELRKLERKHIADREELEVLRALKNESLKITARQIDLEGRENVLKAKNAEFKSIEDELAQNRKKADQAREEGEKKGYADGVADGLREATKITGEDRKMMGQIAALAASSHQGDASKEIASAIAKDIHNALPATTKKQ